MQMIPAIFAAGDIGNLLPVIAFIAIWAIVASLAQKKKTPRQGPPSDGATPRRQSRLERIFEDFLRGETPGDRPQSPPQMPQSPPQMPQPPRRGTGQRKKQPARSTAAPARGSRPVRPPPPPAVAEEAPAPISAPLGDVAPATQLTVSRGAAATAGQPTGVPRSAAVRQALMTANLRTQMAIVEIIGPPAALR